MNLTFLPHDGGRPEGFRGGDCAIRAVSIATGLPYAEVAAELLARAGFASAEKGLPTSATHAFLRARSWRWYPLAAVIGSINGWRGRYVVHLPACEGHTSHMTAIVDRVLLDRGDCRARAMNGYFAGPRTGRLKSR